MPAANAVLPISRKPAVADNASVRQKVIAGFT
jgi:hypothetical protein